MSFTEYIKENRKKCMLTQKDLADELHTSYTIIQRVERGENVTLKTMQKAVNYFEVPFVISPKVEEE